MKLRLFRLVVCVMLVMSMAVAPISAMAAPKVVAILRATVDYGRLREGPSSEYNVVTTIRSGEKVFYLNERSGAFCKVRTTKGQVGYIYKEFLESYGAARMDQVYYAVRDGVTVYKKADTGASRAGRLNQNDHVLVYKTSGGWAYVKNLSGRSGYVKLSDLQSVL